MTAALVAQHRQTSQALIARAGRDLAAFLATIDLTDPFAATKALEAFLPALVGTYGESAALLAADFYDSVRASSGASGYYAARLGGDLDPAKARVLARWSMEPMIGALADGALFPESGAVALATRKITQRLTSGAQRHILNAGRDTIDTNTRSDKAALGYAREARPDGCSFCILLASRGAVYGSEKAAKFAKHGDKYHDGCHCAVVPDFGQYETPANAEQAYADARKAAGSGDLKDILAAMREHYGYK